MVAPQGGGTTLTVADLTELVLRYMLVKEDMKCLSGHSGVMCLDASLAFNYLRSLFDRSQGNMLRGP